MSEIKDTKEPIMLKYGKRYVFDINGAEKAMENETQSDKNALHLRFILIGNSTVMKVEHLDCEKIGNLKHLAMSNGVEIRWTMAGDELSHLTIGFGDDMGVSTYAATTEAANKAHFELIQSALTEFAANNCFHEPDKIKKKNRPEPRIERDEYNHCFDLYYHGKVTDISDGVMESIAECFGHSIPIYEQKLKFKSEWTKFLGREFWENMFSEYHTLAEKMTNKFSNIGVEIHEFRIWKI